MPTIRCNEPPPSTSIPEPYALVHKRGTSDTKLVILVDAMPNGRDFLAYAGIAGGKRWRRHPKRIDSQMILARWPWRPADFTIKSARRAAGLE